MPELLSCLVKNISVFPAMQSPTTTGSPSMCCLTLYSWPCCSGTAHLCCNECRINEDLWNWFTLQSIPSSVGVGRAATLNPPCIVGGEVPSVRRGETYQFCMQCINSTSSYYIYTCSEVGRLCMYSQQRQLLSTQCRGLGLEVELFCNMHAVI